MTIDVAVRISLVVKSIKNHKTAVDAEALRLRTPEMSVSFDKKNSRSWCLAAIGDSLVRVRLLLEQNFNFIESLGVVAVSRYLFELSIWLHLFEKDERYGLVYYEQLIETQQKYYSDFIAQLRREIDMLKMFEAEERAGIEAIILDAGSPQDFGEELKLAGQKIDAKAARKFSIYAEQAKINGYGFQAKLVEKKMLPQAENALKELCAERADFDENMLPKIHDLVLANGKKKRWEWKRVADSVGLLSEYEFIYAFASKLLHATPVSITTDQKNLEPEEMLLFLKYVEVKIMDLLEIARKYKPYA